MKKRWNYLVDFWTSTLHNGDWGINSPWNQDHRYRSGSKAFWGVLCFIIGFLGGWGKISFWKKRWGGVDNFLRYTPGGFFGASLILKPLWALTRYRVPLIVFRFVISLLIKRSNYHGNKILSTCFLDRKTMRGTTENNARYNVPLLKHVEHGWSAVVFARSFLYKDLL